MATEYLNRLIPLIAEITNGHFADIHFDCRHFFSGAAAYADGRIFMSWTPVGLALKLPPDMREALLRGARTSDGAQPLRYFPSGPIKKDYVVLPAAMEERMDELRHWFDRSVAHVLTLPPPSGKPARSEGV